ncbi:MAG: SMC-Scp complex subunit ScpB [Lachnospiraceae bacterium]|nr:SMC-Scp complex subunit ScpB [Lachnospiraceae bacterium]
MSKETNKKKAILEAVLFTMGESVEVSRLAEVIEEEEDKTRSLLQQLKEEYDQREGGLTITELGDSYQMCSKGEYYDSLIKIVKAPRKYNLTEALMETLSIVAYKQPVTKAEIDKIRGVSCEHAVNRLLEFDLIGEVGRKDAPGKPILFGTTEQFLRSFGVKSLTDLPVLGADTRARFMEEAEREAGLEEMGGTEENPVVVGV